MENYDVVKILGDKTIIGNIGFIAGLTSVILNKNKKTQLEIFVSPLETLCKAAICGVIYSFFATLVSGLFPNDLKMIISVCLVLSILYYASHICINFMQKIESM